MKQLAFLSISSTPSLKKHTTNFTPLSLAESTYFQLISIYLLQWTCICLGIGCSKHPSPTLLQPWLSRLQVPITACSRAPYIEDPRS